MGCHIGNGMISHVITMQHNASSDGFHAWMTWFSFGALYPGNKWMGWYTTEKWYWLTYCSCHDASQQDMEFGWCSASFGTQEISDTAWSHTYSTWQWDGSMSEQLAVSVFHDMDMIMNAQRQLQWLITNRLLGPKRIREKSTCDSDDTDIMSISYLVVWKWISNASSNNDHLIGWWQTAMKTTSSDQQIQQQHGIFFWFHCRVISCMYRSRSYVTFIVIGTLIRLSSCCFTLLTTSTHAK